jgi:protocatechuate 3,4-dioxygenase, alpha subunit
VTRSQPPQTPSQTSGPLFGFALMFDGCSDAVAPGTAGAIRLEGVVSDGGGPVAWPECFLEVWQGDQWARARTDPEGRYAVTVRRPDPVEHPDGAREAPHLNVAVFARGLLKQALTRVYFPDETAANDADPVLALVTEEDRPLLVARAGGDDGVVRFDVVLQGENETPFFAF